MFWRPGVRHAFFVYYQYLADQRNKKLLTAVDYPKWVNQVMGKQRDVVYQLPPMPKMPKRQVVQALPEPQMINDPTVGAYGTRFKKR